MKNKTTLDANAAKKLLQANWGIKADLTALPSERDVNFKAVGDKTYVLKIYPEVNATLKASLNFQNKVLNFLQDNSIHCAPAVIGAKKNKTLIPVSKSSYARLLSFHDGVAWGNAATHSGEEIEQLGRLIATVDKKLASLKITQTEKNSLNAPFMWNMLQAGKILSWSGKIEDQELRKLVEKTLTNFQKNIVPELKKLPKQVIHNDGNDYNIIVGSEALSLIDFGDMIYGPKIIGAAVAAAYVGIKSEDPVKEIAAFVRGYHSINPLTWQLFE